MPLQVQKKPNLIKKTIDTIAGWVVCFNSFMSVMAIKKPERMRDLLAFSSIIVRASQDFNGHPWLEYDTAFMRQAASRPDQEWARIDSSLWTTINFFQGCTENRPKAISSRETRFNQATDFPIPQSGIEDLFRVEFTSICQSLSAPLQDDSIPTSSCTYTHSPPH